MTMTTVASRNRLHRMQARLARGLAVSLVALVAACGGGGSGGGGVPGDGGAPGEGGGAPVIDLGAAQGRWQTGAGATPARTAIIVPATADSPGDGSPEEGAGAQRADGWLLAQDLSRLDVFTLLPDGSVQGTAYRFGAAVVAEPIASTATLSTDAQAPVLTLAGFDGAAAGPLALSRVDPLDTPAVQADAAGTWVLTAGSASIALRWTIDVDGNFNGDAGSSSSTGCAYSGVLQALATATAYRVQFRESCPDGSITDFGGIATLDPQATRLTAAVSDSTKAVAAVLAFSRE